MDTIKTHEAKLLIVRIIDPNRDVNEVRLNVTQGYIIELDVSNLKNSKSQ
jgi:SepF-like predicted cell division protein (DUF552 family)